MKTYRSILPCYRTQGEGLSPLGEKPHAADIAIASSGVSSEISLCHPTNRPGARALACVRLCRHGLQSGVIGHHGPFATKDTQENFDTPLVIHPLELPNQIEERP